MTFTYRWMSCALLPFLLHQTAAAQNVLTGGYNNSRTNASLNETQLTPTTVNGSQFGKIFSLPVDGQIYAQPLYQQRVAISGSGVHNAIFVATAHNTVYAFDADTAAPALWSVNLGPSVPSSSYDTTEFGVFTDISPEIGIIGTPVIDPATQILYVVAATFENGNYYHRLHALETSSGAERSGGPVIIEAQVTGLGVDSLNGRVSFNSRQHLQRPALLLLNGVVYVAFGSHGDSSPWHGWMMGYSAANVQNQRAVFNPTRNGNGGALWQSGRGPAADAAGNIYVVTGNGDSDEATEFSDSVLTLNANDLTVKDWFAPSNVHVLDQTDGDLGAAGSLLIPGTSLLLAVGKMGMVYVLDTASLGHISSNDGQVPQSFRAFDFGLFNMALWPRSTGAVMYLQGWEDTVSAYQFDGRQFNTTPTSRSSVGYSKGFAGMTISANGGQAGSGILWVTTPDSEDLTATGTLHAFHADDLSNELWNSSLNADADAPGTFTKFANPTVANGKVYLPTLSNALVVYGILNAPGGPSVPVITGLVNAASYAEGPVAPGEIVTMFGQAMGPKTLVPGSYDDIGNLNLELSGIQVTFNDIPAPLLYVSSGVLAAIVPFEVASADQVDVEVSYDGSPSIARTFDLAPAAPGIFTLDSSGRGQAAVLNQDSSNNSVNNPAGTGSVVALYATGGGQTDPQNVTGASGQDAASLVAEVSATVGGQAAQVVYAGHAPGEVAGMVQVNLQIPAGVTGNVPVVLTIGGRKSQDTATVAIR